MKYGKKILTILIVAALITATIGGVIYGVQRSKRTTVNVYRVSELNYGSYTSSESTMEGYVTADAAQNVYTSDALVVKEVVVREGQEVVVGDVLLIYDIEKIQLNLEKAKLTEETIRLQLDVANRNLAVLDRLTPVSTDDPGDEDYYIDEEPWEEVPIGDDDGDDEDQPPYKDAVCYDILDEKSIPYNIGDYIIIDRDDLNPDEIAGMTDEEIDAYIEDLIEAMGPQLGTEKNPYRFLCRNGASIEPSFIYHMRKMASDHDGSMYIQLEVREEDKAAGALIEAWEMDASRFIEVAKDWSARVIVDDYLTTPSPTPTVTPSVTPTPGISVTVTPTPSVTGVVPEPTESPVTETPAPTETPDVTEPPSDDSDTSDVTETPSDDSEVSGPEIPDPVDDSESDSSLIPPATDSSVEELEGAAQNSATEELAGSRPEVSRDTPQSVNNSGMVYANANMTMKFLLTAVDTDTAVSQGDRKAQKSSQIASALGLIPSDAQMTAEEIKEARKQEMQTIKSLKLDLREALLKIKAAEKAVEEGYARAKMNGVVKTVTDPAAAKAQGTPVVQVTAAEGLFVKSALPENLYGTVKDGDFVSIMSWTSGQSFSGRVREVSFYPDTSGMFGYGGTTTYYPMTVYISERSEALNDGEWVQVTVNGTGDQNFEQEMDDLYLYKAFIRDDSKGKYVLKRDRDGMLVRQYIEIGELRGEGYEILSGVTEDDWIAFPYGRNLTEGSKTREATIDEFYSS